MQNELATVHKDAPEYFCNAARWQQGASMDRWFERRINHGGLTMATRVIALTSVATNLSDPATTDVGGNPLNLEASPKVYFLSRAGGSMVFVGEGPVVPLGGHPLVGFSRLSIDTGRR